MPRTILGIPTPSWTGSATSLATDMVTAIGAAIAAGTKGIATTLIDPTAFNQPVDNALSKGIPVIAYNADEPGNDRMAYVGQNNLTAGAAAAKNIVASGLVSKGDLVAGVIATPGTGNIQPRIDGAKPTFVAAGYDFKEVGTDATQALEEPKLEQWYLGNKDVKAFYCVDSGDSIAAATIIEKYNLGGKVGGSGWDIGLPVLQQVQNGQFALHHRPAGVPARLRPDDPAVPLQHLGWVDEALQHRHRPRFCDQRKRGRVPEHLEPLRRQHQGSGRLEASCSDRLNLNRGAGGRYYKQPPACSPRPARRGGAGGYACLRAEVGHPANAKQR